MARSRKASSTDKPKRTCTVTDAGLRARQQNATRSTGPRTEAGRQASCMNALKDGCYSQSDVLPTESPEEFQAHVDLFVRSLGAVTDDETLLAYEAARDNWRRRRVIRADTGVLARQIHAARRGDPA